MLSAPATVYRPRNSRAGQSRRPGADAQAVAQAQSRQRQADRERLGRDLMASPAIGVPGARAPRPDPLRPLELSRRPIDLGHDFVQGRLALLEVGAGAVDLGRCLVERLLGVAVVQQDLLHRTVNRVGQLVPDRRARQEHPGVHRLDCANYQIMR